MQNTFAQAKQLSDELTDALDRIGFEQLVQKKAQLDKEISSPSLWENREKAQDIMKRQALLAKRLGPWQKLRQEVNELLELCNLGDESLADDLTRQYDHLRSDFEVSKNELKFSAPYDEHAAIVSIYAGAGGTDAQDWAQMLLRMYVRWAERNDYTVSVIEESAGEEAGLKSVTFEIDGSFIYGKLRGEHGVHRLVRLSPFNADNLRQTSFAKVDVLPKIEEKDSVEIDEKDLRIDVYRSGGHGGQSVNTTDSAVRVTHIPTGISVAIQNERSQLQNKETALTILRSRLAQLQLEQHRDTLSELKGPNQSAEWGSQIRSYVLHPYKQVKDLRTKYETSDPDAVLDGEINPLINAYLEYTYTL